VTHPEIVGKIIHLRQHYHFGPMKITMYLQRYHDIQISQSGVWRILKRLDMNRLPASQRHKRHQQRWKRYEKQRPGHHVQVDVKFIEPITTGPERRKRYYQYTAIDDCTRLRVLRIYPRSDQKTAIQFLDYLISRLPFQIEKIQTDNGAEFQSAFHWHVLDQGIGHIYIRPATPRLNGKVERSHRIDAEEFYRLLEGVVLDDAGVFNDKLKEWEDYYNFQRPHGGLGGQTPYERLLQRPNPRPSPTNVSTTPSRRRTRRTMFERCTPTGGGRTRRPYLPQLAIPPASLSGRRSSVPEPKRPDTVITHHQHFGSRRWNLQNLRTHGRRW
jgi:transposase InsO family protein